MLKKITEFIKAHKKISIALAVVLIIVIVIAIRLKNKPEDMFMPMQETEVLSKMDVETTVSASGKIVANESKTIVSPVTGVKVLAMNCEVGDVVSAGDVICTLDTTELEYSLADAKTSLAATNVTQANSIDNASMSLTDTQIDGINDTYRNISSVEEAERVLGTRQGELAEAERVFDIEYKIYSEVYSEDRYYDLVEKQANGTATNDDLSELSRLGTAKSSMEAAKAKVDSAQQSVNSAQAALTSAREKYSDTVRHDISNINRSTNSLEDTYAGDTTARLGTEKSIRQYEEQIAEATVTAPISGMVTAVNYSAGDRYSGDTLVVIEDSSKYKIEANIDEYDISDIAVGQKVLFKTNATGSEELEGVVSAVAPRAASAVASTGTTTASSSTASYKVTIDILSANDRLRLDMSAKINIITSSVKDVYAISSSAIRTDDMTGETYIEVQEETGAESEVAKDGTPAEVPTRRINVRTGLVNDYYTEIESADLREGMVVLVTNDDMANIDDMMFRMGPMGGM